MFDKCGKIGSVSIPIDRYTQRNKGFAFVTFEERADAEEAKAKFEGVAVEGRKLRIDWDVGREKKEALRPPRDSYGAPRDDYGSAPRDDYAAPRDDYVNGGPRNDFAPRDDYAPPQDY
ncbi:hypothetical protein HDV03_002306 [Kappamyces sp. JEL0829]|nr:hypothetical protein HDV03_002306 [Kappamyces sp. JEL0829]